MEKLELKHLAGYLPNGLKLYNHNNPNIEISVIGFEKDSLLIIEDDNKYYSAFGAFKPILRPLSDLTKEIEVNGEKFVPYIELAKKYAEMSGYNEDIRIYRNKCYCYSKSSEIEFRFNGRDFILNGKLVNTQYHLFLKLQESQFDIYGLIEANLAIDINTLKP